MDAFKAFNKDMTCRGFQFEEGKEYAENHASLCRSGFHACLAPIDTFLYYNPGTSVFHRVQLDEVSPERQDDSKVCAKKIKIGAQVSVGEMIKAQFEYVKSNTTTEHTDPKLANAGYRGAANAGNYGAANAGDYGAAISRGSAAVGKKGVAVARGHGIKVQGGLGSLLVIALENDVGEIVSWKAATVDGEVIKANTWYRLEDGEFVEMPDK